MWAFVIVEAGLRGEWDRVRELVAHNRRAGAGLGQDPESSMREEHLSAMARCRPKSLIKLTTMSPPLVPGIVPHIYGSCNRERDPVSIC